MVTNHIDLIGLTQVTWAYDSAMGFDLEKAIVWSVRKFGAFLVLRHILSDYPA